MHGMVDSFAAAPRSRKREDAVLFVTFSIFDQCASGS